MRNTKSRRSNSTKNKEGEQTAAQENESDKQRCPQCKSEPDQSSSEPTETSNIQDDSSLDTKAESWVRCDKCKVWFHWRCAGNGSDLDAIDKWFCSECQSADPKLTITFKPPARKSARKKVARDYASLHNGIPVAGVDKWHTLLEAKDAAGAFAKDPFRRMGGSELTLEWADSDPDALCEPILIESPEGLGMSMPQPGFTVSDVARIVGEDKPVEVMDVATQSNTPGYTMGKWAAYFSTPPEARDRIRNVISLEISDTPLGDQVVPPRLVRELDWVEKFWPPNKRGPGHTYPKVQLYCLMGVAKAWTDWHIDFAGSSVYYHIHSGAKIFYFIRPTPANLAAYERWSGSELQTNTWLGDLVDVVYKVELTAGNTMIIPTGWIHAVYTPVDTLVFGGNFLHSYNIATQLRVREIENATRVPKKFQFPFFTRLCWYAGEGFLRTLKAREDISMRVLSSLEALANYLVSEARLLDGSENSHTSSHAGKGSVTESNAARKKEAKESVPGDRVKDAPALARELRWRVRIAAHGSSDVETENVNTHPSPELLGSKGNAKRRRKESWDPNATQNSGVSPDDLDVQSARSNFRNFVPKRWDKCEARSVRADRMRRRVPVGSRLPPAEKDIEVGKNNGETGWADTWIKIDQEEDSVDSALSNSNSFEKEGEEAAVEMRQESVIRIRRTSHGLERQKIDRIIEFWEWDSDLHGEKETVSIAGTV